MNDLEEFPALSSLPSSKSQQNAPNSSSNTRVKPSSEPKIFTIDTEMFNSISPESIAQTDLTAQDFGYALTSSLNLIPDTPFEVENQNDEKSDSSPYPRTQTMKLLQPAFFAKYDLDTLFFIFFYLRGTPQQYFAGKELKKRNWFFHKEYQTWFKLNGEPMETTDTYQRGRFDYFDHSTNENWMIRPKPDFRLEYSKIEND